MRKVLLSAAAGLALLAGANSAAACPSDSKIGLAAGAVTVGYIGWNTTMGVSEVGAPIGIIAFGLYNNYCKTGSMFKAPPSEFVTVVAPPYNATHVKGYAVNVTQQIELAEASR